MKTGKGGDPFSKPLRPEGGAQGRRGGVSTPKGRGGEVIEGGMWEKGLIFEA